MLGIKGDYKLLIFGGDNLICFLEECKFGGFVILEFAFVVTLFLDFRKLYFFTSGIFLLKQVYDLEQV